MITEILYDMSPKKFLVMKIHFYLHPIVKSLKQQQPLHLPQTISMCVC